MPNTDICRRNLEAASPRFRDFIARLMDAHSARGIAVAVIDTTHTLYQDFFGYRDAEARLTIGENTLFGIASVSKSFAALSSVRLHELGAIDLAAPVSRYIPEFKNAHQKTVTPFHLLSHTAGYPPQPRSLLIDLMASHGLPTHTDDPDYDPVCDDTISQLAVEHIAAGLDREQPLLGEPGAVMSYSNDSFALISDIVRRHGGEGSYPAYVEKNIFRPLGMTRSTYRYNAPSLDPDAAKLYTATTADHNYYFHAFVLPAGGGIKTTLADLKKYIAMYLRGGLAPDGTPIAAPAAIALMTNPRATSTHGTTYGLGLMTDHMHDLTIHHHGGSLPGVSSHIAWTPELGIGAIVLCNTQNVPVAPIADTLIHAAAGWGTDIPDRWTDEKWDDAVIAAACGHYRSGEGAHIVIARDASDPCGVAVTNSGERVAARTVRRNIALLTKGYSTTELHIHLRPDGTVPTIRLASRVLLRSSE